MVTGDLGNKRLAGKTLAYPDWQTSTAVDADADASPEVPLISTVADAETAEAIGRSEIPLISTVHKVFESEAVARSELPETLVVANAFSGEAVSRADIPEALVVADASSGEARGRSELPVIETVHDASTGEGIGKAEITLNSEVADAEDAGSEAEGSISTSISIAIAQGIEAKAEALAETTIVTWKAGLGGTVVLQEGGSGVEGAEVHVIRDNDNTKVASTTTDSNGRWHVTLPGGKTTDSDPEVYSIEVWYRDGSKRDKSATLYNAKNRPFIDTADPSGKDPYEDDNIRN